MHAVAGGDRPSRIECRGLRAGYGHLEVLRDVSFTIDRPAVYVVLGPNGAGKTTLFRALAGILPARAGTVTIGNDAVDRPTARDRMHYLSHLDGVPEGLRVREALEFYARVERAAPSDVDRVLDRLELRELAGRFLAQLSAGQKKRVSIARIFLRERAIYLLDEPTSNLDPKLAREIRGLILELGRERVVLYSSHNLYEAREIGEFVLVIRDGRLALFDRIENLRGSRFVVGLRLLRPHPAVADYPRQGEYFVRELKGPEEVPGLVRDLETQGVLLREVREMENPLEELFG